MQQAEAPKGVVRVCVGKLASTWTEGRICRQAVEERGGRRAEPAPMDGGHEGGGGPEAVWK